MSNQSLQTIGPLLACAISDAYGAGFEFTKDSYIKKHNRMQGYTPHPKFERPEGAYTDDTQMALGVAEHMLSDDAWTPGALATRFVTGFHRDPHTGYAHHFYNFLLKTHTGDEFLQNIQPHSTKNGGAMRAFPCGFLIEAFEVRDKAMFQASLTHATYDGMQAAAAAALTFHFCYHNVGPREELGAYLEGFLPGTNWTLGLDPAGHPVGAVPTVQKAIGILLRCKSVCHAIEMAVSLGGDTDTVAAIVAPCAAVCEGIPHLIPEVLFTRLEHGKFGRDYLIKLDGELKAKFPPQRDSIEPKVAAKPPKPKPSKPKPEDSTDPEGPLDFLFQDN